MKNSQADAHQCALNESNQKISFNDAVDGLCQVGELFFHHRWWKGDSILKHSFLPYFSIFQEIKNCQEGVK